MGVPKLKAKVSVEDYLEGEQTSQVKHEYLGGEVYAMAGASGRHNIISSNLAILLRAHLRGTDCDAFFLDMKLRVTPETFYYPDVFVSCGEVPEGDLYREQPVLVIEVVSLSTRQIDRREKLRAYQSMPSVQEYVLIEQDKMHIELHRRQPNGSWITYFYDDSDRDVDIEFMSVGLVTNLDAMYERVKFPEKPTHLPEEMMM